MKLLTAGAALAAALITGGVPALALIAEDPPVTESSERSEARDDRAAADGKPAHAAQGRPAHAGKHGAHGKPPHAGKQGAHGNPHGSDHGANMRLYAEQHAEAMQTWGPCRESLDSPGEREPSRAEKLEECGPKPTPPGHLGHSHPSHRGWHELHPGSLSQARPSNR